MRENGTESENESRPPPNENTLWVFSAHKFNLPEEHRQTALLVLQALLIHGSLTAELRLVLPAVGGTFIVAALIAAGFDERDAMRCRPAAYPAARAELFAAGFPMDRL